MPTRIALSCLLLASALATAGCDSLEYFRPEAAATIPGCPSHPERQPIIACALDGADQGQDLLVVRDEPIAVAPGPVRLWIAFSRPVAEVAMRAPDRAIRIAAAVAERLPAGALARQNEQIAFSLLFSEDGRGLSVTASSAIERPTLVDVGLDLELLFGAVHRGRAESVRFYAGGAP